jgi:O-antigen/teichoic acid export membrane protein
LIRNFGFLAAGRTFGDLSLFALLIVISRRFGPDGAGQYGVAVGVAGILALIADFGLTSYTIKAMSPRRAAGELLGSVIGLRALLGVAAFAAVVVAAVAVDLAPATRNVLILVSCWFLLRGVAEGLGATFIARDESHVASTLEVVFRGAGAATSIAVLLAGGSLVLALAVQVPVAVAQLAATWLRVRRRFGPLGGAVSGAALLTTARSAGPYAISRLLTQLTQRIAVPAIGVLLGASAAGLYHAADRFVYVLSWIPHFVGMALLPTAVRRHADAGSDLAGLYQRALGGIVLIGIPAAVGLFLVAPGAVERIFGGSFAGAVPALQLLAPLVFVNCIGRIMGIFLLAVDRIGARSRCEAVAMVTNAIGILVFVPRFGIRGAALAILVAEIALVVLFSRELAPLLGRPQLGRRLAVAAAGSAGFTAVLLGIGPPGPFASIAIAAPLYGAFLMLSPGIRNREGRALLAWLRGG